MSFKLECFSNLGKTVRLLETFDDFQISYSIKSVRLVEIFRVGIEKTVRLLERVRFTVL